MATTTFTCNKDVRVMQCLNDSYSAGAGGSDYLPIGVGSWSHSGGAHIFQYRSLVGFSYSFAGMVSITSAILHIKTSGQYYVAFGSDPDVDVRRLSSSWTEGSDVALSSSAPTEWNNQPGVTGTTHSFDVSPSENTWDTCDVTTAMQEALAAGVFYGFRLSESPGEPGNSSNTTEFYAREYGSNDCYISITYTTNVAPSAPTSLVPTGGVKTTPTPTITFTHVDSDGDALLDYDLQVSTDSTFASVTHWNIAAQTTGISGNNVSRVYAGTALSRNTTYYWRARTSAATGILTEGAWSAAQQFKVNQLPTTTLDEPSAAGRLGKISFVGGSGQASPWLNVTWTFVDPDAGDAQSAYQVLIQNDTAGSPGSTFHDSGKVSSGSASYIAAQTLTEGNYYHVTLTTWDSVDESVVVGPRRIRVRWGFQAHRYDTTAVQSGWSLATLNTTAGTGAVVLEYGSDSAANATPASGWKATFGEASPNRYFYYRAWLLVWGASPGTSPTVDKLVLNYSSSTPTPYHWTLSSSTKVVIDVGTFVYGTQSIKFVNDGTTITAKQTVVVLPNTNMILSGRYKMSGNGNGLVTVRSSPGAVFIDDFSPPNGTTDWVRFDTGVFNTGANTAIEIELKGTGSTGTFVWFDALKLEASTVVTPWTPGYLSDAVVLDAGGIIIDSTRGGIGRFFAGGAGARDYFEVDPFGSGHGILFAGDTELHSPAINTLRIYNSSSGKLEFGSAGDTDIYRGAANELKTDDSFNFTGFLRGGGTSFPASPSTNDRYFRTDLLMEFIYDGTRWLSTQLFTHSSFIVQASGDQDYTATANQVTRFARGSLQGGTDHWLVNWHLSFKVASGGTALGASHKWVATLNKVDSAKAITAVATINIDSGASDTQRNADAAIGALLQNGTTYFSFHQSFTKTGTPGNLYALDEMTYRIVAT